MTESLPDNHPLTDLILTYEYTIVTGNQEEIDRAEQAIKDYIESETKEEIDG